MIDSVRTRRTAPAVVSTLLAACCLQPTTAAQPPRAATPTADVDPLVTGFDAPPSSARPRVWWHWMNGNITKDGIREDLEWMHRVGIGGLQNFDANLATPEIVDERLVYMTAGWQDAFRFAAELANELDLELTVAASPGWSETGGPWVEPRDGMKKVVWSGTTVPGGRPVGALPAPPDTTGPFLDLVLEDRLAALVGNEAREPPVLYADIAVLAFPVAAVEAVAITGITTADGSPLDTDALTDGHFDTRVELRRPTPAKPTLLTVELGEPRRIRSASLFIPGAAGPFNPPSLAPRLEVGADGGWRQVANIALSTAPTTVSFPAVTGRRFRVVIEPAPPPRPAWTPAPGVDRAALAMFGAQSPTIELADLRLSSEARIHQFETKAGFSISNDYYSLEGSAPPKERGAEPTQVIDLSDRLLADGSLDWTPPPGTWRVLRLGWSLTGKTNHPAPVEATGLEVDKLDGAAVRRYLQTYLRMYRHAAGRLGDGGVEALLTDSIEVGPFNWTPRLLEHFERLRGYDARPWLPTLTGAIVGSRAESDRFLYDFRRTIADLLASEHYGTVAAVAHEHGLVVYGEALEGGRPSLGDDIDMRRHADHPMAALWTYGKERGPRPVYLADMRGAASTAHLFDRAIVAAESMTSALQPWAHAPADLRPMIDLEFASGINRPVIHTSVHQPVDDKQPGLSLLIFGQFLTRHETWAEMARPWIDYLARSSYLLQQGRFVADVAYFYGEEAPPVAQVGDTYLTDVPTRYGYDFVNATAVAELLQVEDGELVAPSGARYRVLYLAGTSKRMTLPLLRRLAELAAAGATIVGEAPAGSPSLNEDTPEYADLVARLWSGGGSTRVGRGRVIDSDQVEAALAAVGVPPDLEIDGLVEGEILFVHRRLDDGDLYFLSNRGGRRERTEARFRVSGKAPEIWRADTGAREPASYRTEGGQTIVPLELASEESFFVVFRRPTSASTRSVPRPPLVPVETLEGPWQVSFQSGRGAPASLELAALASLSTHADPGVRHFSGIATYGLRLTCPTDHRDGEPLVLDLGAVGDLAEVHVNGRLIGTVWHAPFQVDIGSAVRPGANELEVRVANLWVNRLIGDAQPGAEKVTFTTIPTYRADAPLRPSGLIGPVRLLRTGE